MKFLHRADIAQGNVQVVETTPEQLRNATFLDGREKFWSDTRVEDYAFAPPLLTAAPRFLFHLGFCGSTLLAKSIDQEGACLALKEPQCLTDIASQKQLLIQQGRSAELCDGLKYTLGEMGKVPTDDAILIKPSNWANGLLPILAHNPHLMKPGVTAIFLEIDLRNYLRAAFRGGRERLAFCARLASLLAPDIVGGTERLEEGIAQSRDPLDQAANIVAFLHAAQSALFDDAMASGSWAKAMRCTYQDIASRPAVLLAEIAELLGLPQTRKASDMISNRHAKDEGQEFSSEKKAAQDAEVEKAHSTRFDKASAWIESSQLNVRGFP